MYIMMIKNPLYRLYLLASTAFILALIKYVFMDTELSPEFLIVELLSFSFFLGIIYLSDRLLKANKKDKHEYQNKLEQIASSYQEKISQLENRIENELSEKRQSFNTDEIDIIAEKIANSLKNCDDLHQFAILLLRQLANFYEVVLGICYFNSEHSGRFSVKGTFGLNAEMVISEFEMNDGLNGQAISDKRPILIDEIDEEYFNIESCSGYAKPKCIYLLPIVKNMESIGLVEIATFSNINIEKHWEKINSRIVDTLFL